MVLLSRNGFSTQDCHCNELIAVFGQQLAQTNGVWILMRRMTFLMTKVLKMTGRNEHRRKFVKESKH